MHKKEITGIIYKKSGINSYVIKVEITKKFPKLHLKKIIEKKVMIHSIEDLNIGQRVIAIKSKPISKFKHYIFKELK